MHRKLKDLSNNTEKLLLIGLIKDKTHYKNLRNYLSNDSFLHKEHKEVFSLIKVIYDNYNFNNIDDSVLNTVKMEKNIDDIQVGMLDAMIKLSERRNSIEVDVQYDFLRKYNGTYKILEKLDGDLFEKMFLENKSASEINTELKNMIADAFGKHRNAQLISDLDSGMQEFVFNGLFSESNMGIKYRKSPILNSYTQGIPKGLSVLAGFSGTGKTTIMLILHILSLLENKEKVMIISNEMTEYQIRKLILMGFLTQIKGNIHNVQRGELTKEGEAKLSADKMQSIVDSAKEFEERYAGQLRFLFVPKFNPNDLEDLIETNLKDGFNNIMLDTLKINDESDGWSAYLNLMVMLDGLAKENSLRIAITSQLSANTSWRRYLTDSCLAKAKGIKETLEQLLMFRNMLPEEIPVVKYDGYIKKESGEIVMVKGAKLDQNKQYILMFIDKNRNGKDHRVIIFEYDADTLFLREIGETTSIKNDDGR